MIYVNKNYVDLTGRNSELISDLACIIKTLELNDKKWILEQANNLAPVKVATMTEKSYKGEYDNDKT